MVELIDLVNLVLIFLSQTTLLTWLTFLLGSLTVIITSPTLLDLFIPLDLVLVIQCFPCSGKFWSCRCLKFPLNSKEDAPFHSATFDWDSLYNNFGDISWENIFKMVASDVIVDFWEWDQAGIDVYITHPKYQAKPGSSSWFSTAYAAPITHKN